MSINFFVKSSPIVVVLLSLCFVFYTTGCNEEASQEHKMFFNQPLSKQHDEFLKLPIEKQFDIYIYAMTKRHPPDLAFADDIAEQGEKAVPFLIDKLKQENRESIQQKIIFVFERMARQKVNIKGDKALMALLENTIASMNQSLYIERSKESLSLIKGEGN